MELILIILIISLPLISQIYITLTYKKTSNIEFRNDITGYDIARNILDKNGLNNILIVETNGTLTDHYDPTRKVIKLSKDIYHGNTIASASVAAHEVGHAIQDKEGYIFLRIRHAIYPIVSFLDKISYVVILIGFLLQFLNLIYIGIITVGAGVIFQIITLPVEINASKRAIKELNELNLTTTRTEELSKNMLKAAALTYVAGTLASLLELLRLITIIKDND